MRSPCSMRYVAGAMALGLGLATADAQSAAAETQKPAPAVEVVFVVDTTGSMGGLIEGAKQKVWSIVNRIAEGKPTPKIKIGLVAYRDRGDQYVTKVTDLSEDLDEVFKTLMAFAADGGGDSPESVNQALAEAVSKISWSGDDKTLKMIFLVGDCPPHMDYADDVKYPATCQAAVKKDIVINTVQCGNGSDTTPIWTDIATRGEGTYVQIAQSGGVVGVATPYDERMAALSRDMDGTVLHYGKETERRSWRAKAEGAAMTVAAAPAGAAPDRAEYKAKAGPAPTGAKDLVTEAADKKLDLAKVAEEEMPDEMKKMTPAEREAYIAKKAKERERIRAELTELSKQRNKFIEQELKKRGGAKDAFDAKVIEAVKVRAEKKGISYGADPEPAAEKTPEK